MIAPAPAGALIVNADDLGETAEITRGILECVDAGVVTSTTILANMPATPLALREAASRGRRASFGVHLNLCEGPPLTAARSLAPRGRLLPKRVQARRAITGRLNLKEVETEFRAQIACVADAGVQISHLDSHKHLHQLPGVADVVLALAREFGVERVRCTLEAKAPTETGRRTTLSGWLRRRLARRLRGRLAASALRHPARTFDLSVLLALTRDESRVALLRSVAGDPASGGSTGSVGQAADEASPPFAGVGQAAGEPPSPFAGVGQAAGEAPPPFAGVGLPGPVEMVCHPGTRQADLEKPGSCSRFQEYRFLRSGEFPRLLERAGVRLATFWEV